MTGTVPRLIVARGPRAAERWLLEAVRAALSSGTRELARPLRVVVPSASLREHVCGILVRSGHSWLGVRVQTLGGLAHEVLERAGVRLREGDRLFSLLLRRELEREPALARLARLDQADAAAAASVRDLLDAGLTRERAEPLLRAAEGAARAGALVEVALHVAEGLERLGYATEGERYSRAAERLRARGPELLPARAVLVHGFAEATGRASELIEALVSEMRAKVVLDHPPDPLAPEHEDPSVRFTERLRRRIRATAEPAGWTPLPANIRFVCAPGTDAEVRAAASGIRTELERGTLPERIGLLARDLGLYQNAIRAQLGRLAIPFSGRKARGPALPHAVRLRALLEALRLRGGLDVDGWMELRDAPGAGRGPGREELGLGLHTLGALTLGDVAGLDLERALGEGQRLRLPLVRGVVDADGERLALVDRAGLSRSQLEAERSRARLALIALDGWPEGAPLGHQLQSLRGLTEGPLGWRQGDPAREQLEDALVQIALELPLELALEREELVRALAPVVDELSRAPLGGNGGGVQVLDVMEARGHTFDALFVLGLNRGRFPRAFSDDPLLDESVRAAGRSVLPELPRKSEAPVEERYLYAQLCSASPEVVLSFQTVDDDARELARSPVIERQLLAEGTSPAEPAPSLHAREQPPFARPAFEHAVVAGLLDARASFERALSAAARERGDPPARADARARTRIAILEEIEPGRRSAAPGPYFGWVGPPRELGDPRRALYYVTRLESLARCPWQTFLARVLRLEAPPDALEVLPRLHAGAIGNAVHRALERIVGNGLVDASRSLSETLRRPAVKIDWPSPETLETILLEACERAARDGGIALPGFERALAELARPYLARARALLFADGSGLLALGVEVEGELDAHGKEPVRFKADLVEERGGTRFVWDYKTGTVDPFAPAPASKLRERLIEGAASGAFLQAAAYTAAARHEQARGGYAFLGGSFAQEPALVACDPEDTELDASLSETLELLRGAVEAGTFPPRLELTSGSEPSRCGWCELGAACLRGDSGPRRRLRSWVDREPEGMDEKERVYRALYRGGVQR